jgi:hypothetical protein
VLFTETQIVVGDPPVQLPTFSFEVHGNLETASGTPLPGAPVKITFFNQTSYATTGPAGAFSANLTVPANAPDGIAYVDATFAAQGAYGPSMNLTSIEVAHLPLKVTLDVPNLSLAGFTTTVSGTLTANGTAVPYATVIVGSPWGQFQTQSDGEGRYVLAFPVSISEFALAQNLLVSVTPIQAYIQPGQATTGISLLNPLLIILPAVGVGVTAYELDGLGLMPKLRRHAQESEFETGRPLPVSSSDQALTARPSGVIFLYLQALALANRRLKLDFKNSATIREMIEAVWKLDGAGAKLFSNILIVTEDFLYTREFDSTRIKTAEEDLTKLKELWGG